MWTSQDVPCCAAAAHSLIGRRHRIVEHYLTSKENGDRAIQNSQGISIDTVQKSLMRTGKPGYPEFEHSRSVFDEMQSSRSILRTSLVLEQMSRD